MAWGAEGAPAKVWLGAAPSGACAGKRVVSMEVTGDLYCCSSGAWVGCGNAYAPSAAHYVTTQAEAGLSAEAVLPTCTGAQKITFNGTTITCSDTLQAAGASALGAVKGSGATTTCPAGQVMNGWSADGTISCVADGAPAGAVVMIISGTCVGTLGSGWSEEATLSGRYALGTVAASGNVGTTGGSTDYTPAGTNSAPTFIGNAVDSTSVSGGTPAGTNSTCATATFTADAGGSAACSPAFTPTFTGSALAGHQHSTTATGSVAAPTFTGAPATIQPPFARLIFCRKT